MLDMTQNELALDEKQGDATKKTDVDPIDQLITLGRESYNKGNLEEAFQTAQKILAIDEKNSIGWRLLGVIYKDKRFAQFNPRESLNCFLKAQELEPHAEIAKDLGNFFRTGFGGTEVVPDKAFKYYLQAKELGTTNPAVWYQLGICYETAFGTEKNPNEAFVCYKKATELNDKSLCAWQKLAECYEKGIGTLPNLQEEIRCRKKITELDGKNAKSWNDLGCLYTKEDKPLYAQAFECFKKATEIDDKLAAAWYNLGVHYKYDKNTPPLEAIECFQKAIDCDPNFILALNILGIFYFESKDVKLKEAFHCFERITQLDPLSETAWFNLGFCYLKLNQSNQAFNCFNKATQINADFTRAWEELAFCHFLSFGTQYNPDEVVKCLLKAGWKASDSASSSSERTVWEISKNRSESDTARFMGIRIIIQTLVSKQRIEFSRHPKPAAALLFSQHQRSSPPANSSPATLPLALLPPSAPSDALPLTRSGEKDEHLSVLELKDKEIQLWKQQNEILQQLIALKESEISSLKQSSVNLKNRAMGR